ncbi:histone-lysine n-methyltransferase h3 lysine-9 specific suvh1 [Phtheirospermum japonicum]|uniref:Histone-lysine n-methyltransferase h3 lysine-9 specific suvh1 n=1 Tax=Phtheirospermum japonicum TaxID=374723 RepID=A0A830CQ33_9LAMI|nr:histone-lysine n-methyltransferase h3 lysine-9 specific suvh1 [Phtheirospermum japonicum]
MSSVSTPHPMPFTCVSPSGPYPPGVQPFYPFMSPNATQQTGPSAQNGPVPMEEDGYSDLQTGDTDVGSNNSGKQKSRARKRVAENIGEFDFESLVNTFLASFKLNAFDDFKRSRNEKEVVETVLLVFDMIRRKLTQLEEAKHLVLGIIRQPGPKAAALLTAKGIRANSSKRIGPVPGIEVGDIFFFRMELCLVGVHAPSMAGIDYMSVKLSMDEEPVAVSIVSSGGYDDDDGGDGNVLIYTGSGGVQRKDGQMFDQKLERGNLALEKSLHRGNDVRVIRGIKDILGSTGKIYVYDGLFKIQESWAEKNKLGCSVFKYKLVRGPGQPEAFGLWKLIQQWKDGTAIRTGVVLPDLTSGGESQPVALVNEVDGEKGPTYFTYISSLRYTKPFSTPTPSLGCNCKGTGCQPGNSDCPCNRKNDGLIPYSSLGLLLTEKPLIRECGRECACPPNCRNRISQAGIKVRLEVFKTKNRGWGIRSWDPIRAGCFICEYAGDAFTADNFGNESGDNNYIFDTTRYYEPLEKGDSGGFAKAPFPLVISAKNNGNVARFMNHSCSPNVFWRPVLRESNGESYLHVAFFAIRHIPPMQELTYDYGLVRAENGDRGKKKCACGSVKCRGYFY